MVQCRLLKNWNHRHGYTIICAKPYININTLWCSDICIKYKRCTKQYAATKNENGRMNKYRNVRRNVKKIFLTEMYRIFSNVQYINKTNVFLYLNWIECVYRLLENFVFLCVFKITVQSFNNWYFKNTCRKIYVRNRRKKKDQNVNETLH